MQQINAARNHVSLIAFSEHTFAKIPLMYRSYHEVRERFGLPSASVVALVRSVAAAYRDRAKHCTLATFGCLSAIPLYKHRYKRDGTIAFYGFRLPFQTRTGIALSNRHDAMLSYRDGKFFVHQPLTVNEPEISPVNDFIGCDLGIINILVDSDGQVYSGGQVNGLRQRHARLRSRLQAKGTHSAKRLLHKRRRKEQHFARDVNHCISKRVVAKAHDTLRGIALEDLGGIRGRITVRRAQRRQHHSWAFAQLRAFLEYKAALVGVPVVMVDPRNTSRTCPACGCISKANRVSQSLFSCVGCGFAGPADAIAARNISGRALGDAPYAASLYSCKSTSSR